METVSFTQMVDGTVEDYALLAKLEAEYTAALPERILQALEKLGDTLEGYQISRLEHSLQSATRAEADGADIEMIVGALIHDLGDELSPANHSQLAAAIIRPYVRDEVHWIIEMHGLFQMAYYGDKVGEPTDRHLAYRDHPYFEACVKFCRDWDQASFDPAYKSKPLEHFAPMVREIFGRNPFDPDVIAGKQARN